MQDIENGGLKMPNITLKAKAIKMSWIKRIIVENNNFTTLACANGLIKDKHEFFKYKNHEQFLDGKVTDFYRQVIGCWYDLYCAEPKSKEEILNECLWNNAKILIGDKPVEYKTWKRHGINYIHDLLKPNGTFKEIEQLQRQHMTQVDLMQYNSLKSSIPKNWLRQLDEPSIKT